ncbi:MAG: hypothetical protein ACREO5_03545, partial [Candidatus Binatia bacterium]
VLIRSVEECDKNAFSDSLLMEATAASKNLAVGLGWVKQRASYLYDRLPGRYRSILHLAKFPTSWTWPICTTAVILGVATNLLGSAEKIHVVRNPVLLLVAWNLLVYLVLVLLLLFGRHEQGFLTGKPSRACGGEGDRAQERQQRDEISASHQAKDSRTLRFILPGVYRLVHKLTFGLHETKTLSDVVRRFSAHWIKTAGPLVSARWSCLLHLGSLCLATGAIAGMYFRGLFQGYEVIWDSTFLTMKPVCHVFFRSFSVPAFSFLICSDWDLLNLPMCRGC